MATLAVMALFLHHIVIDAHDLPGLAWVWSQVLGWTIVSEREREIVIGSDEHAAIGICFMPVTDKKSVKNRVHLDLNPGATLAPRTGTPRSTASSPLAHGTWTSGSPATSPGPCLPIRRATSSA